MMKYHNYSDKNFTNDKMKKYMIGLLNENRGLDNLTNIQ